MKNEPMLMYDDVELKEYKLIGFINSKGNFYQDKHLAKYDDCTHVECKYCGEPVVKHYSACQTCIAERKRKAYNKLEKQQWDGKSTIYIADYDEYVNNADELLDFSADVCVNVNDMMLYQCKPEPFRLIDIDFFDTHEDYVFPDKVLNLMEKLNNAILKAPVNYWVPSKIAVKL